MKWLTVNLFGRRMQRNQFTADLERWISGGGRATAQDAKLGAISDTDLADYRHEAAMSMMRKPRGRAIFEGVAEYFSRASEDYIAVIHVLLASKANPNCRYKVEPHDLYEWTPTLFAAQIGHLELFKLLIHNGGDPTLTLKKASTFENYDAMWIAVAHDRKAIVNYLIGVASP